MKPNDILLDLVILGGGTLLVLFRSSGRRGGGGARWGGDVGRDTRGGQGEKALSENVGFSDE